MESFFSRYKNGLVLLVVLLAQLIGLALQVRRPIPNSPDGKPVRLLRYWMVSFLTPPARVSHGAGKGARGIWSNYIDLRSVRRQNIDLQAEIDRLRLEQGALAEDARQGQRLQHLLDFKEHYIYQTTTAQVIATAGTDRSHLLIIDKGANEGVRLDMPVITPDGIVGRVREVFPNTAEVLEISDPGSGAGVMLETTRIRGVMRGNAYGEPQIINIMPDDRIKPGESVITSGGDQIYPRGMPVGVVERVANDPERNPYVDVVVKPGANLSRLEEVLVITSTGDQLPATESADLAKNEAEAKQHSAAEVLSEKLPSVRDPNAPPPDAATSAAQKAGDAAPKPLKPPPPLHPDRFTPGAVPDANAILPGASAPPVTYPPHANSEDVRPETTGQSPAPPKKKAPTSQANSAGNSIAEPRPKVAAQGTLKPHPDTTAAPKSTPANAAASASKQTQTTISKPAPTTATPSPAQPKYVEPYFVKPQSSPEKPGRTKSSPPAPQSTTSPRNDQTPPPQGAR